MLKTRNKPYTTTLYTIMKKLCGIFLLLIFMSCKETYHGGMKYEKVTKEEISRLTNIIEKRGNIPVYEYTKFQLEEQYQFKELLPIAKLMSDKHQHENATYDVYLTYKNINGFELSDLTKIEQKIALKYLLKAYINGNKNAENDLEKYSEKKMFVVKKNNEFKLIN